MFLYIQYLYKNSFLVRLLLHIVIQLIRYIIYLYICTHFSITSCTYVWSSCTGASLAVPLLLCWPSGHLIGWNPLLCRYLFCLVWRSYYIAISVHLSPGGGGLIFRGFSNRVWKSGKIPEIISHVLYDLWKGKPMKWPTLRVSRKRFNK